MVKNTKKDAVESINDNNKIKAEKPKYDNTRKFVAKNQLRQQKNRQQEFYVYVKKEEKNDNDIANENKEENDQTERISVKKHYDENNIHEFFKENSNQSNYSV